MNKIPTDYASVGIFSWYNQGVMCYVECMIVRRKYDISRGIKNVYL